MKSTFLLLPFLLCAVQFCKGQQIDVEHQKKAEKIIERLKSGKPLPDKITCESSEEKNPWPPYFHQFHYRTKRMVNGQLVDKVLIEIYFNDTLSFLDFDENYIQISDTLKGYHYTIDNGDLIWAYRYTPMRDSLQKKPNDIDNTTVYFYNNSKHDSTPMIEKNDSLWIHDKAELEKHRERDRKSFAFYEPKLLKSIDELYDLLFK